MSSFSWLEWVGVAALIFMLCLSVCFIVYVVVTMRRETKLDRIRQDLVSVIECLDGMESDAPIKASDTHDLLVHVYNNFGFSLMNFKSHAEFFKEELFKAPDKTTYND